MRITTIEEYQQSTEEDKTKARGVIQILTELYEKNIEKENNGRPNPHGIHASEIHGCLRKSVYSLLGTERLNRASNTWKKRFRFGHTIHDMLQRDFRNISKESNLTIDFTEEVTITPSLQSMAKKWGIESHCDGVFTLKDGHRCEPITRAVVEIKSEAPDSFKTLNAPKEGHIWQAHIYMACLNVPFTWFLYFNKGNQNYTVPDASFLVAFDPYIWKTLEERFQLIHDYAAKNELPEREESILCEFCSFSHTCEPTYLNRIGTSHKASSVFRRQK